MAVRIGIILLASWSQVRVRNVRVGRQAGAATIESISDATEGKVMKEKDMIKGEKLERIENELFGPFGPDDESCIGGDRITNTAVGTFAPGGPDALLDLDFWDFDAQSNSAKN